MVDDITDFFTSKTGIFAACAAVVSIIGGVLGIVRPWLKERRNAHANVPNLVFSRVKVIEPPPWSEAGQVVFELVNTGGGVAVAAEMWLLVLEHELCEKVKEVEHAAPVPQFTYKVKLDPKKDRYDIRAKKFGPKLPPHSFAADEVESYVIDLTSVTPQRYRLRLEVEWYDTSNRTEVRTLCSEDISIEFPAA